MARDVEGDVRAYFEAICDQLGYQIMISQHDFPDYVLMDAEGNTVRVEAEVQSSGFRDHGHDPKGCDLIVCWRHDWLDSPVEVLELQSIHGHLDNPPSPPEIYRVKSYRISDEVHKALRIRSAETGESMGDIAERALRKELGMARRVTDEQTNEPG